MPDDLTKDGLPKAKTGPKPGSTMINRRRMAPGAHRIKEAAELIERVGAVEKEIGLVGDGPLSPKTYPNGQVPDKVQTRAYNQLLKHLSVKGNGFTSKDLGSLVVYDIDKESVWLVTRPGTTSKSHCKEMSMYEFFRATGMVVNE